jgi:cysteate synthase
MKTDYKLLCLGSGAEIEDTHLQLDSGKSEKPAFLRAIYKKKQLEPGPESDGLFKFASWLPVNRLIEGSSAPVTYKSEGLAGELGLDNLYITFSGFWPERNGGMVTGTFKECEAYSVCARLSETFEDVLVVASAGNTARAFIHVCSKNRIPLIAVIPERNIPSIWVNHEIDPCVRIVASGGDSDYFDAINLSGAICSHDGFTPEGGAKNVARRDGMGTTVLSAATEIGTIPDCYFQAVGSGTGAIAAWEANLRLLEDGRFGGKKMRLMLSQNAPFTVLVDSWKRRKRELAEIPPETARALSDEMYAKVLSNRVPPYSLTGGLFDALEDTGGEMFAASNLEALEAGALFGRAEGVDIAPAAAVAVSSLEQAVIRGDVNKADVIMLNVTGGGYARLEAAGKMRPIEPNIVIDPKNSDPDSMKEALSQLFK